MFYGVVPGDVVPHRGTSSENESINIRELPSFSMMDGCLFRCSPRQSRRVKVLCVVFCFSLALSASRDN